MTILTTIPYKLYFRNMTALICYKKQQKSYIAFLLLDFHQILTKKFYYQMLNPFQELDSDALNMFLIISCCKLKPYFSATTSTLLGHKQQ